ncbi:MAG: hypothetical protein AAGH83_05990 [Pseudomonadota bacterium]
MPTDETETLPEIPAGRSRIFTSSKTRFDTQGLGRGPKLGGGAAFVCVSENPKPCPNAAHYLAKTCMLDLRKTKPGTVLGQPTDDLDQIRTQRDLIRRSPARLAKEKGDCDMDRAKGVLAVHPLPAGHQDRERARNAHGIEKHENGHWPAPACGA